MQSSHLVLPEQPSETNKKSGENFHSEHIQTVLDTDRHQARNSIIIEECVYLDSKMTFDEQVLPGIYLKHSKRLTSKFAPKACRAMSA